MQKILVIGDIYSETQYFLDEIPDVNQFMFAKDALQIFGSKTINAARIFSRLNCTTSFFGFVGDDQEGKNAPAALEKYKINSLLQQVNNERTGKIVVLTNKEGKSSIVLFAGSNAAFSPKYIDGLSEEIESCDIVYTATSLPLPSLYYLVEKCNKANVPICVDVPNQHNRIQLDLLSSVLFFIPNRQETELLINSSVKSIDNAKNAALLLRKEIKGNIIITLDKDGCVVLAKKQAQPIHFACNKTNIVDDTAAGDIFRAVFVKFFLETGNIEKSIRRAIQTATQSTLIKGVDKTLRKVSL